MLAFRRHSSLELFERVRINSNCTAACLFTTFNITHKTGYMSNSINVATPMCVAHRTATSSAAEITSANRKITQQASNNNNSNINDDDAQDEKRKDVHYYKKGDYYLIPKKYTIGKKIAIRSYHDRLHSELTDRTYLPQKHWFNAYDSVPERFERDYQKRAYDFYNLETKLIWKAFDLPELIGMFMHDETIKGNRHMYSQHMLESALHYVRECRYWRCIGITKPFYDAHTLRAHCWEDNGLQVGTLVLSQAMRHALMDLERAVRRVELGLPANYLWDKWGPVGFIDGSRTDYLPRFEHNPYIDPDGVEVTELDILPFNTHELIKERYGSIIFPDTNIYEHIFASVSHGALTLRDVPSLQAIRLYKRLKSKVDSKFAAASANSSKNGNHTSLMKNAVNVVNNNNNNNNKSSVEYQYEQEHEDQYEEEQKERQDSDVEIPPVDLRALFYLSTINEITDINIGSINTSVPRKGNLLERASQLDSWAEVIEMLEPVMDEHNAKIEAARMLQNTRHDENRVRAFYEEKCGFHDFMYTPDKVITAAVLSYLAELHHLCLETTWGEPLALALTDNDRVEVMGQISFMVYRAIESAILERKRRAWAYRFAGESNEENTLDYLLENFGRRTINRRDVVSEGTEFDREQEPIGRNVQRRVIDADKAKELSMIRKRKGRLWSKRTTVFDSLHERQMQRFGTTAR